MAGALGGGGLGDIAIRYGYNRYQFDILIVTVILLVILVQIFQIIGMKISKKTDKRIREQTKKERKNKNEKRIILSIGCSTLRRSDDRMRKLFKRDKGRNNSETAAETGEETSGDAEAGTKLTVAASPTPHAEILNAAKEMMAEKGIELEVIEFTDYVQPNKVVDAGDVDANYFQHFPYLENFNEEQGTKLVSAGSIHYEPLGIYPGKSNDLANIADGAEIIVPNDATNEARALLLLETNGVITLKEGAGLNATANDIDENPTM